jgi:tetratricopeptide (TPR) repeat protein
MNDKTNTLIVFLLALCFNLELASQESDDSGELPAYKQWLAAGDSLLTDEEPNDAARKLYKKAMNSAPEQAVPYHKTGRSFLQDYFNDNRRINALDSAAFYENKARTLDPHYINAIWNEVLAYRLRWKHGMSRKVLMEAWENNPDNTEILTLLGRNYFDTGNPGLALPFLEKAIALGGTDVPDVAYRFAGWCWFYLEDHEKQLEYFNRFRELDPKSLMGIAGQVHSYTGLKDYDKATELALQIKTENPDYTYPAYLEAYIAETYLFGGNKKQAATYYEKAMQIDSTVQNLFATRAVTTTLGYLYVNSGKQKEGFKLLQQTIQRRLDEWETMPERWEFSFDIASAYAAMGEMDKAFQWLYTSVLTGYPGHLWNQDPLFKACHDVKSFQELVKQARIRVEGEYNP